MIENFFSNYCVVEFLCSGTTPNWIGWSLIVYISGVIAIPLITVITNFIESEKGI